MPARIAELKRSLAEQDTANVKVVLANLFSRSTLRFLAGKVARWHAKQLLLEGPRRDRAAVFAAISANDNRKLQIERFEATDFTRFPPEVQLRNKIN